MDKFIQNKIFNFLNTNKDNNNYKWEAEQTKIERINKKITHSIAVACEAKEALWKNAPTPNNFDSAT